MLGGLVDFLTRIVIYPTYAIPLQQAVVCACSDTGLGQSKVVTYLAN